MCGIAGFCNFNSSNDSSVKIKNRLVLEKMADSIARRGPDGSGIFIEDEAGLCHRRLAIIDPDGGQQPISRIRDSNYTITYNGELYNTRELRDDLISKGWDFQTKTDTEVLLVGVIEYGVDFVKQVNGIFAFAIWDSGKKRLYLCRDRLGVKPLFYTQSNGAFVFGSELKALFAYGVEPVVDCGGLNEIFSLGPAKTSGKGVFKNIFEVKPGEILVFDIDGIKTYPYWELKSFPHTDDYGETIEKTAFLLRDSILRQTVSDVPICAFLSGGLDSSLVTALCARLLEERGTRLATFSFDFKGNDEYYKSNAFQPSRDRPYVDLMTDYLKTEHYYLECDNQELADALYDSVDAKDLPGMADVDSSLLYFCGKVGKKFKVTLTGECADEIFGGYPWFWRRDLFYAETFPWSKDFSARKTILKDDFILDLGMEEYANAAYQKTLNETPALLSDSKDEKRRREIAFLNLKWFMQTLLDRMDRASMRGGLEARVPFADHRIVEYVWNIPWSMKFKDGIVKNILREAGRGIIPDEALFRKKSPYPKTYNPEYENILAERLRDVINNPNEPANQFIDKKKAEEFINAPKDLGAPWYGQLMAGPQRIAYFLQINYWLKKYGVKIEL
jgi:asparagine synthase (glutamine-hydrolysing)